MFYLYANFSFEHVIILIFFFYNEGLGHSITTPVRTHRNHFFESHGVAISRSMTEKKDMPRHDLKLDRLSEREKVNISIIWIWLQVVSSLLFHLSSSRLCSYINAFISHHCPTWIHTLTWLIEFVCMKFGLLRQVCHIYILFFIALNCFWQAFNICIFFFILGLSRFL